jgi:hypothetical protein
MRFRDLPDADALHRGFRKLTQQWTSEYEAESKLERFLEEHGLRNSMRSSGIRGSQKWHLETEDGEPIKEHLNVFHRPGVRPGWTAFQVSL